MIGSIRKNRAAKQFELHSEKALMLNKRCIATWKLIESEGKKRSDFPMFDQALNEICTLHLDFLRFAAFLGNYDAAEDDSLRLSEHMQAAAKLPKWWARTEAEVDAAIADVESTITQSHLSEVPR